MGLILWFAALFKPLGAWLLSQVVVNFVEWLKNLWAEYKRKSDAKKTTEENDKRLSDAIDKGDDDEIADASGDLLSGRRKP